MSEKSFSEAFEAFRVVFSAIPMSREKSDAAINALKKVFGAHQWELCEAYKDHPVASDKKVYRAGDEVPDGFYALVIRDKWPVVLKKFTTDNGKPYVHAGFGFLPEKMPKDGLLISIDPPEGCAEAEE